MISGIIQARLNSERFPKKIMQNICGKTVLEHCYYRVNRSEFIDNVIVAVPNSDLELMEFCSKKKMLFFGGNENDVLERFYITATAFNSDHIVRITSDCPLIDPEIIDMVIREHIKNDNDLTTNSLLGNEKYPDGMDVTIITRAILNEMHEKATGKHREHVVTYAMENPDKYKIQNINPENDKDYSNIRLTLDYREDLKFIKIIFNNLIYNPNTYFNLNDILEFLDRYPTLKKMNEKYSRNENYYKNKNK